MAFLSTPSARRATFSAALWDVRKADFYPRPPRGGRPSFLVSAAVCFGISIHALREEGDASLHPHNSATLNFYPRPPRGGRRPLTVVLLDSKEFLSTPSARRATLLPSMAARARAISIHALREEGDQDIPLVPLIDDNFYPRPPRGGRPSPLSRAYRHGNFYPRPPRGGRHRRAGSVRGMAVFLSTPSARRATFGREWQAAPVEISIHALREEGDSVDAV